MPEEPKIMNVYDSMAQCAKALGINLSVVKRAKKDGCTAFKSNRVYTLELIQWLANHKRKVGPVDSDTEYKESRALITRIRAAKESGMIIGRDVMERRYRENLAKLFQDIRRRFVQVVPSQCEGLTASEIADINERELDEVQETARARAKKVGAVE